MRNIYLSICIPTNGRIEIIKNTLDSIYINSNIDFSEFEVILSDNSTNDDLVNLLEDYKQYPNIVYSKSTSEGFLNSVNALKLAKGSFLKLHNNYTMLTHDALSALIELVKKEQDKKPLVFFTNGQLNQFNQRKYYFFDTFLHDLSFWCTWSTGFSIWKEDFDLYSEKQVSKMFPHTSLLLYQSTKIMYIIDDTVLFTNQDVNKKGGYNLFKTFSVDFLKLIEETKNNGSITISTFNKIKKDLFHKFLVPWYRNTKIVKNTYTYDLTNIRKNLSVNYSTLDYYKLVFLSYLSMLQSVKNKVKQTFK